MSVDIFYLAIIWIVLVIVLNYFSEFLRRGLIVLFCTDNCPRCGFKHLPVSLKYCHCRIQDETPLVSEYEWDKIRMQAREIKRRPCTYEYECPQCAYVIQQSAPRSYDKDISEIVSAGDYFDVKMCTMCNATGETHGIFANQICKVCKGKKWVFI